MTTRKTSRKANTAAAGTGTGAGARSVAAPPSASSGSSTFKQQSRTRSRRRRNTSVSGATNDDVNNDDGTQMESLPMKHQKREIVSYLVYNFFNDGNYLCPF